MAYEQKVDIAEDVKVEDSEGKFTVSGPKGNLERVFVHPHVSIKLDDGSVMISTESKRKRDKSIVGTWAAHLRTMMKGVTDGFEYKLKIVYSHFPMSVSVNGDVVEIKNYLGGKDIKKVPIVGESKVVAKKEDIIITGINRYDVGQTAANLERSCLPKGKDRRVFQDGIYLVSKE